MQLHHKVFSLPIVIMVFLFSMGLLSLEYNLTKSLDEQFKKELESVATVALNLVPKLTNKSIDSKIDTLQALTKQISESQSDDLRVTYIDINGTVLGDSDLSPTEVKYLENHGSREEIIEAIKTGVGTTHRYSDTLNRNMIYLAVSNKDTGYIARVSKPETSYQNTVNQFRLRYGYIIIATIIGIILFGIFIIKWMKKAVAEEQQRQQQKISTITREITLLQAMTNLLLSAEKMQEAGLILNNIIPKLLPTFSGAIFIKTNKNSYFELSNWGGDFPGKVSEHAVACWQKQLTQRSAIDIPNDNVCNAQQCDYENQLGCIGLYAEGEILGVMQLHSQNDYIDADTKKTASALAEHVSSALANLQLKTVLRKQATRDPLTNLYNRRFMLEHFEQTLNRAERHKSNLAVLMVDLDYFKQFNDRFGHDAGDMILNEVASQFRENLRLEDIACRYGGEEFCVVCTDTGLRDAYILAEKLRNCVNKLQLEFKGKSLARITMSIGIAIYPNHAESTTELIAKADKALYLAKSRGRNCTVVAPMNTSYQEHS